MYILSVLFSSKCSFFHNSNIFGSCIIHILYIRCAKIKKIIPAPKVKQDKPWFDGECLGLWIKGSGLKFSLYRIQAKANGDNLNKVRREVSRHFRNKKMAYLIAKIEELETNNKILNIKDLYRGISDFKKGYQPRCNIAKDENGDWVADSHGVVARWRKHFSQLFNVPGVKDAGQTEIHTAEPLVPQPSASEVELLIDKLKSH